MLAVPFLGGILLGGPAPADLALLVAWPAGYVAVHHGQQWLRLRRVARNPRAAGRHVRPGLVFGAGCAALGAPLLFPYPWLVPAALCAVPFVAVNTYHAWRNRERALLNGLAAVVPACGMLAVTYRMGSGSYAGAWPAVAACLLYFGGTVPHVKTMIRERNSPVYRRASVACHALALAAAALLSPWLALPFAVFLARAVLLPPRRPRIAVVGAVELTCSLLLLATLPLAF